MAFPFLSYFVMSCRSCRPLCNLAMRFCHRNDVLNNHKLRFYRSLSCFTTTCDINDTTGRSTSLGVVFLLLMVFGEVEHFVHLIRWNLNSRFCPRGWPDYRPGKGMTHDLSRILNWVLVKFCFFIHELVPHWSPISCVLPSPGRSGPLRAEVDVGFRFVRLVQVQALPSSPPSAGLVPCPSALRFSFSLPFQGLPVSG